MTISAPEATTCSCKYLVCTPHRRLGVLMARLPRVPCDVHAPSPFVDLPLPWSDSDPVGDINKAIIAMTPEQYLRGPSESSAPSDSKETT